MNNIKNKVNLESQGILQIVRLQYTSDKLHTLVTSVVSGPSVNVDMAKTVEIIILNNMTSKVVSEYVFKASSKAGNMSRKLMLKDKKGETVSVESDVVSKAHCNFYTR